MQRLAGVLFWAWFVTGCGGTHKPVIAMVPQASSHRFWQAVHAGAVKAAQEFNVDVDWQSPADPDAKTQTAIVDRLIGKRVAALAIAPADANATRAAVERAAHAAIPVALFASETNVAGVFTHVTSSDLEAGRMAARRLAELMVSQGECAIVGFQAGDERSAAREGAFRQEIKQTYPKVRIVETVYSMGSPAQATVHMNNILAKHPALTGIFADTEWSSAGVVTALRMRSETRVRVVAFDANRQLVSDLQDRLVDALIIQDAMNIGYETVKAIAQKLRGETPADHVDAGLYIVDRSNLEDPVIISVLYPDVQRWLNPPRM